MNWAGISIAMGLAAVAAAISPWLLLAAGVTCVALVFPKGK